MADLDISIAGRSYRVACADGEEDNLTEAARLVAAEAEQLREQFGTRFAALPEPRVLLMASLMLGDRFRAHLAEEAEALAEAAAEPAAAAPRGPAQSGFFDDPVQAARISELEAALADARAAEGAALAALEEAAERIRALAGEIAEDGAGEDDDPEAAADDEEEEDAAADDADPDLDEEAEIEAVLREDDVDGVSDDLPGYALAEDYADDPDLSEPDLAEGDEDGREAEGEGEENPARA